MKVVFAIIITCLISGQAEAARMKDMSLSPEESFKQPNIITQVPGLGGAQTPASDPAMPPEQGNGALTNTPSARFMDGYCDPNFRPAVQVNNPLQNCLQQTRLQACDMFRRLPQEAQNAVDQTVTCANTAYEEETIRLPSTCKENDRSRLQLIKKYWQEKDTAYALVFLPGMVTDTGSLCTIKK